MRELPQGYGVAEKQTIPAEYRMLRIIADDQISATYSIKAMPTIYLLDKGNIVVLKDCTPELLISVINNNYKKKTKTGRLSDAQLIIIYYYSITLFNYSIYIL